MDIETYNNDDYIDFSSIKDQINKFKSKKIFKEADYLEILNDLDKCYNIRAKKLIQKWSHKEDVLKEKEEFRKYLINNLFEQAIPKKKI